MLITTIFQSGLILNGIAMKVSIAVDIAILMKNANIKKPER